MSATKMPPARHAAGDRLHGFTIDRVTPIADVRAVAYEATHDATGARVLHLHADDPENLFAIGFRTPPSDSTGVPHILEHSVLAGSERFPVKDAFNELSRGSLATFINAMTWPDKTVYPVSSAVRADFFNLVTVYLDVTLHPRLSEETFRQEGHHLELADLDDLDSDLVVSGVVYNEMKGVYSSESQRTYRYLQEALYPDTCYGIDSGGDPGVIPSLTYEDFCEFHRRFYSLSNARLFLYGDISTADQFAFLERELSHHGPPARVDVDSSIDDQPRWDAPRRVDTVYPVAADESLDGKTVVNVAWMTPHSTMPEDTIVLEVVAQAILGSAAGPLRKALLESGLGEDVSPQSGFETEYKQTHFCVGLRGTEPERAEAIERLALDTLARLATEGIDEELVRGAFHQFELASKEIGSNYPLRLLMRANETWTYDGDPREGLALSAAIEAVRARWKATPTLFTDAIRTWLLENPHRLLAVSRPSATIAADDEKAFRAEMAARKAQLDRDELARIAADAKALKLSQETPDPPEVLATLPRVTVAEIPREMTTVPTHVTEIAGVEVHEHELFTGGVTYLRLSFDVSVVPDELHPLLPLLGRATTGMGAAGLSYDEMARRKSLCTGGVSCSVSALRRLGDGETVQRCSLGGRALDRHVGDLVDILRDLATAGDLTDARRASDILLEMRNGARGGILNSGHIHARLLALAAQNLTGFRQEQYSGYTQLRFLDEAANEVETRLPELLEQISTVRPRVFDRARLLVNVTADADGLDAARRALPGLLDALPSTDATPTAPRATLGSSPVAFALASQVNFVAEVAPAPDMEHPLAPALSVLSKLLTDVYFYEKIRVQGGAYGGFSLYDPVSGQFSALSYRDPHIKRTLDVFAELGAAVRASDRIDERSVEKAIIGTIGTFDRVLSPTEKGGIALRRHLLGVTDDIRRRYRAGILDVTPAALLDEALPAVEAGLAHGSRAVVGSREQIEEANTSLTPPFEIRALD